MILSKKKIYALYLLSYLSLLLGFYFNEDTAGGQIQDYNTHINLVNIFINEGIINFLLDYSSSAVPHSPFYVLYILLLKKVFIYGEVARLINLHLVLFLPIFFYKSLSLIYNTQKNDLITIIPILLFFSPYFRSGSIWIDDSILGLSFFVVSIYFFLKLRINNYANIFLIFFHVFFLALSSYFRPIYSIFSIYFFIQFISNFKILKKIIFYIIVNIIISFPAIYYVFILKENYWITSHILQYNVITSISLSLSVIFFYSIPFLFINYKISKNYIKLNSLNVLFTFIYFTLLINYFYYDLHYSGGILYKISKIIFKNDYFFIGLSTIIFYVFISIIKNYKYLNELLIFFLLINFGVNGIIYHRYFDPLLYIVFFLLIKHPAYDILNKNISYKKYFLLFIFSILFYIASIFK
jgi:hypothetical protein